MAKLTLGTSPKFRRLCRRLGLESPAFVVGLLDCLWNSCHSRRSPVVGDLVDIEAAADWPVTRPQGELAAALIEEGFLDEIVPGRSYAIHDYWDHCPQFVKKAIARARAEDVTIGPETYFLGIDAFRRLFEDPDAIVQGEVLEGAELDVVRRELDVVRRELDVVRPTGNSGSLSCLALAEPKPTPPPKPPPSVEARRRRGARRRPAVFEGLAESAPQQLSAEELFAQTRAETLEAARIHGASAAAMQRLELASDTQQLAELFEAALRQERASEAAP